MPIIITALVISIVEAALFFVGIAAGRRIALHDAQTVLEKGYDAGTFCIDCRGCLFCKFHAGKEAARQSFIEAVKKL